MNELEAALNAMMSAITRAAEHIAALPLEAEDAALTSAKSAHFDEGLQSGLSPSHAEALAESTSDWTRTAIRMIRERRSLDVGTLKLTPAGALPTIPSDRLERPANDA